MVSEISPPSYTDRRVTMTVQESVVATTMAPEQKTLEEGAMVHKERWEEVRRRYFEERKAIAEIARGLDMDRKTVACARRVNAA
jgi:ActR/RegA family two-component response regulator